MLLILYSTVTVPVLLCFDIPDGGGFSVFEWVVDSLFMADILFTFRTGRPGRLRCPPLLPLPPASSRLCSSPVYLLGSGSERPLARSGVVLDPTETEPKITYR